jgi:hypothetical protein
MCALALLFLIRCIKINIKRSELNIINIVSVEIALLSEKYFNLHSLKLNIICSSK